MSSLPAFLGLSSQSSNLTPYYLIIHFLFAYVFLSSRFLKVQLKIDNNVAPREDVSTTGEAAVKSGKITRSQLNMVKRNEAAHANATEHYPVFAAAMVLASSVGGVENAVVNGVGLSYTVARVGFAVAYILIESRGLSFVRTGFWWWGNVTCLWLLWQCGKKM